MVAVPGLHREVVHPRHDQQVAAAGGGGADDVEQAALGEVAVGDEQDVRAVDLTIARVEVGEAAELRDDRLGDAVVAVVDEADDGQPVARVVAQDLRQLGGEGAAADQDGAVLRDPAPPADARSSYVGARPGPRRPGRWRSTALTRKVVTASCSCRRAITVATTAAAVSSLPSSVGSSSSTLRCSRAR